MFSEEEQTSPTSSSSSPPPSSHFIGRKEDVVQAKRVTKLVGGRDVLVLCHQGKLHAMDMRCYLFYKNTETRDNRPTGLYIADELKAVIIHLGPQKIPVDHCRREISRSLMGGCASCVRGTSTRSRWRKARGCTRR
ncbi:unnamed protein product [Oncorhynchus mykiss]|uniref:Soluble Rieske-type ferredoxin domain-containing protein n=1 Tax=Oncorhynchus mykiss TaxID=8022 RepID=A0A060XGN9_ONCMY|nr:unnamed protein product [Oncorhynchus mykiss]